MADACIEFFLQKEAWTTPNQYGLDLLKNWWSRNTPAAVAAPTQAEIAAGRVANPRTADAKAEAEYWKELDAYKKNTVDPEATKAYFSGGYLSDPKGYIKDAVNAGAGYAGNTTGLNLGQPFAPSARMNRATNSVQTSMSKKIGERYGITDAFNIKQNGTGRSVDNWAKNKAQQGGEGFVGDAITKGMAGHNIEQETKDTVQDKSMGALKKWGPWVAGGALLLGGGLLAGKMMGGQQPTQQNTQQPPLGGTPSWAKSENWGNFNA